MVQTDRGLEHLGGKGGTWSRTALPAAFALLLGAFAWELLGRGLRLPFLPPLSAVLARWVELVLVRNLLTHLGDSLFGLLLGFSLAVLCGLIIGGLMGRYRRVEVALGIYIDAMMASPSLIYVPVLFSIFGISRGTQAAVVFLYAFFIIAINTSEGIRRADRNLVEMARAFGASEPQLYWNVMVPAGLPLILAGVRLGAVRAVKGMVNGELFIALVGLGALIRNYGGRFDAEGVYAVLLLVFLLAVAASGLTSWFERRHTGWLRR